VPLRAGPTALRLIVGGLLIAAIVLAVGLLLTKVFDNNPLVDADRHVERWLAAHRTPWLNHVTFLVTWMARRPQP